MTTGTFDGHDNIGAPDRAGPGWFERRTFADPQWSVADLVAAKRGRRIAVVIPALNEAATIVGVLRTVTGLLGSLIDEVIVIDSGSSDDTVPLANEALTGHPGGRVMTREAALPGYEAPLPGKGEVLWRSLAATTADLVAFMDSDLIDPDPEYLPKLLGPLLFEPGVALVKAYYRRPLRVGDVEDPNGGGRVTELVARPMLTALRAELGDVLQPLSGEYAATRELLLELAFPIEYGVEVAILLDTFHRRGMDAIAQVNLGTRAHRNRPLHELAPMSRQIMAAILQRCSVADSGVALSQFSSGPNGFERNRGDLATRERPPMATVLAARDAVDDAAASAARRLAERVAS